MAENIELRLKLIDEFSANLKKLESEVGKAGAKAESAFNKVHSEALSMNRQFDIARTSSERLAMSMGKAHAEALRMNKEFDAARASASGASRAISGIGSVLTELVGPIGITIATAAAIKKIASSAMEAETASVKLRSTLKAAGFKDQADSVEAWAQAMLMTKGVSDELSASLVANAVAKGVSVRQAKELVSASADLAVVTGDLAGTFAELTRASDGDQRSMQTLASQFNIVYREGMPFSELLEQLKKKSDELAKARLDTAAGQFQLFFDNVGNAAERWGKPIIDTLGAIASKANELTALRVRFTLPVEGLPTETLESEKRDLQRYLSNPQELVRASTQGLIPQGLNLEERLLDIAKELARQRAAAADESERSNAAAVANIRAQTQILEIDTRIADGRKRREQEAEEEKKRREQFTSIGGIKGSTAVYELEKALAEKRSDAVEQARVLAAAERELYEIRSQAEEAIAQQEEYEAAQGLPQLEGVERRQRESEAVAMAEEYMARGATETADALREVQEEAVALAEEYETGAKRPIDILNEAANKTKKLSLSTELASVALQGIGVAIGTALQGGNVGSALAAFSGQAIGKMVGDKLGVSLGKSLGPAIGGALGPVLGGIAGSLAGGVLDKIIGGKPPTKGEEAQDKLYGLIRDVGVKAGPGRRMSDEDFENLAQGAQDLYKSWAKLLTGEGGELEEQARILAGSFETLDLTTGETSDAIALMKSRAEGTAFMAEKQNAAWAALISTADLTREEFEGLVSSYREGYNWQEQYNAAVKKFKKDLESGASTDVLIADRAEVVGLLKKQDETQKKTEQELRDAGVSQDAINTQTKSVAQNTGEMNTKLGLIYEVLKGPGGSDVVTGGHSGLIPSLHHGRMVGGKPSHLYWIRNDEWVVPPEKMRWAAERMGAMTGGYQPTVTVNLSGVIGDKRAVAREVYGAIQTAMARREI